MAGFWRHFADVAKVLAPVVLSVVPGVPPIVIPLIVHGITEAEALPGASGAEKKAHVLNLVRDGVNTANATGTVVIPTDDVMASVGGGIDAAVTAIKAVQDSHKAAA